MICSKWRKTCQITVLDYKIFFKTGTSSQNEMHAYILYFIDINRNGNIECIIIIIGAYA